MMISINRNLLFTLTVRHGIGGANFYFSGIRDGSKECADDPSLFILSPKIMIKY